MASRQQSGDTDASHERILDHAIQLFARYGVEGVSLALLADHVGLHKSTLFHHFRGKEELAEAALQRALLPICKIVERLDEAKSEASLESFIEVALQLDDHFAREPASARFLLRTIVGPTPDLDSPPAPADRSHPVSRIFIALGSWLERARRAGAIRRVRVRHELVNLLAVSLLYPAIAEDLGRTYFRSDPTAPRSRRARREELAAHLRATLRVA